MLSRLFGKDKTREAARDAYRDVIIQARTPGFYNRMGVPDTVEGRFDMITLHMFLVLRRLKRAESSASQGESARIARFSQSLFDVMFKDMDDSLRQLGVGDLSVGKKVRGLAENFYGRLSAYEAALTAEDEDALALSLQRNIIGLAEGDATVSPGARSLSAYVREADAALAEQAQDRLLLGMVAFPQIDENPAMAV